MSSKIKLYLLSGFLGAGKTTFLTNVLEELKDKKVGVIMNEFGRVGIDGTIIKRDGMQLVEINRGSIFCSCLKIKFVDAMMKMSENELDYLFVESSGLADPSNIGEVLEAIREFKGDVYDYSGAICIVDALNFLEQIQDLETVERQLQYCHLAIINKADLVDNKTLEIIREKIAQINNKIDIVEGAFGKTKYNFLDVDLMKSSWRESEASTNTVDNKPKTLNLTFSGEINKEELTKFLEAISKDTFRIKGFFKLEDGWNQVDVVNRKIDYKLSDTEETESKLVFISKIGPNIIKPIIDKWNEIIGREMKLKN